MKRLQTLEKKKDKPWQRNLQILVKKISDYLYFFVVEVPTLTGSFYSNNILYLVHPPTIPRWVQVQEKNSIQCKKSQSAHWLLRISSFCHILLVNYSKLAGLHLFLHPSVHLPQLTSVQVVIAASAPPEHVSRPDGIHLIPPVAPQPAEEIQTFQSFRCSYNLGRFFFTDLADQKQQRVKPGNIKHIKFCDSQL